MPTTVPNMTRCAGPLEARYCDGVSAGTLRDAPHALPVRLLRVDVIRGPDEGKSAVASGETLSVGSADGNDLVLTDPTVSGFHLELKRRRDGVLVVDLESTNGTFVGDARIERAVLARDARLRVGRTTLGIADGDQVELALHGDDTLAGLRGRSAAMRRLMSQIQRAALSEASVLVVGESGTGKELVARALHELGPRASGPFVTVDCGALAPTLVASELFGHEKGAFTGAERQHVGAFEQAGGGTLFLDEIGELPPPLQSALLGALERRRFRRVGGRNEIEVDARFVCATHRDLRAEVNQGAFRLDLYYRIAVITLQMPPLRERRDDVPLLVEHFARLEGHDGPIDTVFPPEAMVRLAEQRWPGNVRELRNVVEATLAMGEPPPSAVAPLAGGGTDATAALLDRPYKEARSELLRDFERRYLVRLLDRSGGSVQQAARSAGLDRSHVAELLRRHGLR
jgi:DNA-binding NtrC family response regulator